jgi:protein-S-isoprenylcysteine O-methyltransferase Ste14
MGERRAPWILIGSLIFLVLAPGTVAGLIPYWLTGWRVGKPLLGASILRLAGGCMVFIGLMSLLDSFGRFVFTGLGTPAPVAPPRRLVVSGQYRYVRNPMYVAILVIVIGQGLALGSGVLLQYAVLLWFLFHMFVILYEEPRLGSQFGAAYQGYCRNVRRWWPTARPCEAWPASGTQAPQQAVEAGKTQPG